MATHLTGKRHLAFGDSITSGENNFGKPMTTAISSRCAMVSYNVGIGGTCFARGPNEIFDPLSMYELCKAKVSGNWTAQDAAVATFLPEPEEYYSTVLTCMKNPSFNPATMAATNILTISFGRNDFQCNRPIGGDSDMTKETFKGAINYVLSQFMGNFERLQILLGTPIWTATGNTPNTAGHKLIDYADALIRIGELRSVQVLDLYRNSGINADNAGTMLSDGTHPTADGYHILANAWASALLSRF